MATPGAAISVADTRSSEDRERVISAGFHDLSSVRRHESINKATSVANKIAKEQLSSSPCQYTQSAALERTNVGREDLMLRRNSLQPEKSVVMLGVNQLRADVAR